MDDPSKITPLGKEVLSALFSENPKHAEDLPADDPVRVLSDGLGQLFTEGVGFLKNVFPNPKLNQLGALLWDLVGNQLVPIAVGPQVPTLSFAGYVKGGVSRAIIFVPPFWKKMIVEDSMMQFGALVFNASKAQDFYNNRLTDGGEVVQTRASMYEAEFLRTLKHENPKHAFNEYQQEVMARFPRGLDSPDPDKLLYESKPFFLATA